MQAKKNRKTNKILPFRRDAGFYYKMADEAIAKSDFVTALRFLFHALSIDKNNIDYRIRLAEVYTMMEQYSVSNNIYFEIYGSDKTATDVFYGIGQNYYYENNIDAALYYLNSFAAATFDEEDIDSAEILRLFEESMEDNDLDDYRLVYPEKPSSPEDTVGIARNLVRQNNFEEAAEVYRAALNSDLQNTHIRNNLAMALSFSKKYKEAEETALSVLDFDADNYFALCSLCLIYNHEGEKQKKEKTLKKLLKYQTDDLAEIFKIATTLCEIGEHQTAVKYLHRIHRAKPYDSNILLLIALAEYNSGNFDASLKFFVKLLRIFENDHMAVFYIKYLKSITSGKITDYPKTLPYSPMLPPDETKKRLQTLAAYCLLPAAELEKKWRGEDLAELCDWAMTLGDDSATVSAARLVGRITAPDALVYLRNQLINTNSDNVLRKEIIKILVSRGETKPIDYLSDDIFTTVVPKAPKALADMPAVFREAFASAFAVLCFVTESFETKLRRAMSAIIKHAVEKGGETVDSLTSASTIAAVLCFKIEAGKLMSKKSFLCDIFETDIKTFNKYLVGLS